MSCHRWDPSLATLRVNTQLRKLRPMGKGKAKEKKQRQASKNVSVGPATRRLPEALASTNISPEQALPTSEGVSEIPEDWAVTFSVSQYKTFFRVARACHARLKTVKDRELVWQEGCEPDPESMRKSSYEHRQRLAAVAVVFSALTLESFINHYGQRLDPDVFRALDRSNAEKWSLFPLLLSGKRMESGSAAMNGVVSVFRLRDKLVHDKPHSVTLDPMKGLDGFKVFPIDDATRTDPIKHVQEALKALKALDPRVEIAWAMEEAKPCWDFLL